MGGALAVNGVVFGLDFPGAAGGRAGPPGWVIGVVWILLFTLFGLAHWRLGAGGARGERMRLWLLAFGGFCLAYPFYTLGLSNDTVGLAGNIVTAGAALLLIRRLHPVCPEAALLMAPVVPWLAYASWITLVDLSA